MQNDKWMDFDVKNMWAKNVSRTNKVNKIDKIKIKRTLQHLLNIFYS